jgi:hypothetical protein
LIIVVTHVHNVVRVEVVDPSTRPSRLDDGAVDKPTDWRLLLFDALSGSQGTTPTTSGKVVWFEVELWLDRIGQAPSEGVPFHYLQQGGL